MCRRWHWTWCPYMIGQTFNEPKLIAQFNKINLEVRTISILKKVFFYFHLVAGFHCSFAVVPGISHLAYTHVWPTFLQEVCTYYGERVHQRKRERCEEKILGNLMTGKMIVLAKDFSEDWKKQQDWGPAICGVRELLALTSSIPQKDTNSSPLISGGVSKVSCCS